MWAYIRTVPNLIVGEMWRELLEAEGIPAKLILPKGHSVRSVYSLYHLVCAREKEQVADDALKSALR